MSQSPNTSSLSIKQIDHTFYDKNKLLGKGKYGKVYLGFCQSNQTFQKIKNIPVAVKVIDLEQLKKNISQDVIAKRLNNQITNLQLVQSQNVVKLYDLKSSKNHFYFICQLCNGLSFDAYLKKKGRLTQNQAMRFFKDIVLGFKNLHQKGIVHRDLKPANLLMHDYTLKIADLGLSKCFNTDYQMLDSIVGTPLYMSPQLFQGKYTFKTDIWSLGVILYQMIYGTIPWKAKNKNIQEFGEKIKNEKIKFPNNPEVTSQTKNLIIKMLEVQQQKRVSWEDLFDQINIDQNLQNLQPYNYFKSYFSNFSVIQSPNQIVRALKELEVINKVGEFELNHINYSGYKQFFQKYSFLSQNAQKIEQISLYYISKRNRICYLFCMFFEMMSFIISKNQIDIQILVQLHKTMFLIFKFSRSSLQKMLRNNQQFKKQDIDLFQQTTQRIKIGKLLQNDLKVVITFSSFYLKFYHEQIQILQSASSSIIKQLNIEIGGLYNEQYEDYKFIKFLMINSMKKLFNSLKKEIHNDTLAKIVIMIYQFEKDDKLFDLSGSFQNDLNKKYQALRQNKLNKEKIKNWNQFLTENLINYISKEFKWQPNDPNFMNSFMMDIQK